MTGIQLSEDRNEQLKNLEGEIVWLLHSRDIYRDLQTIAQANSAIKWNNPLIEWMMRNYGYSGAMYVRRLLDEHRNKKYESLSIPKFIERLPDSENVRALASEADDLRHRCERVLAFADKVIAHRDNVPPVDKTQIEDLHKAIDDIVEFFENRLLAVLAESTYYELKEAGIIPRRLWDDILRKSWIPDDTGSK